MSDLLEMFVVYKYPRDYPDKFVVRRWGINRGESAKPDQDWFFLADTLEGVRGHVPRHCVKLERDPNDEPQIVEVWI